eukprot:CAMPEP_0117436240 /NCGR_PEP_ID=MMETSP0759-20121206/904_1 /TAXON_ID=63605 /ORGANISM="Percolomonas cosmopolitus, Strain WS" /LENGTH=544 /DNA_ID=CAMNT_0005227831 /DNA_START=7 /DNA_END=1641 /DNA_ORIENTATION=-
MTDPAIPIPLQLATSSQEKTHPTEPSPKIFKEAHGEIHEPGPESIIQNVEDLTLLKKNSKPTRVAFIGLTSSGKSSLMNALIGRGVCPIGSDATTNSVTIFTHNRDLEWPTNREQILPLLRNARETMIRRNSSNDDVSFRTEEFSLLMKNLCHPLLQEERMEIVDTPGLCEINSGERSDTWLNSSKYSVLREELRNATLCVVLVSPDMVGHEKLSESLQSLMGLVHQMTYDYVIALTKCDTYEVQHDDLDELDFATRELTLDEKKVCEYVSMLESTYHCPVVPVSTRAAGMETFPLDNLLRLIVNYRDNPCTYLRVKRMVLEQLDEANRVPCNKYQEAVKRSQDKSKYYLPIATSLVVATATVVAAPYLIPLVLPSLTAGVSAATITSVLATLGGGSIASGGGGMIAGVAYVATTYGAVSVASGSFSGTASLWVQEKLRSKYALAMDTPELDISVPEKEIPETEKAGIDTYMNKATKKWLDNDKNFHEAYAKGKLYSDTTFVQVEEKIFLVSGLFRKRKLFRLDALARINWVEALSQVQRDGNV